MTLHEKPGSVALLSPYNALHAENPPEQKKRGKSLDDADITTQGCSGFLLYRLFLKELSHEIDNIIKPTQTRIPREIHFLRYKEALEHLKIFKTVRDLYLGLELTMHVLKSQIHLVTQSL